MTTITADERYPVYSLADDARYGGHTVTASADADLDDHVLDVRRGGRGRVLRTAGAVLEAVLAVGQPALVPLREGGPADAAFIGDVGDGAACVDALAETTTAPGGQGCVVVSHAPYQCRAFGSWQCPPT